MTKIYITYGLTLFSAFIVFWMFGLMATVAAGNTWVPFSSFLVSIFHFGLSSWFFLNFPKIGKIIAIVRATVMCIWPISAFVGSVVEGETFGILLYILPISLSGLIIYSHLKTFNAEQRPKMKLRIIMSVIPFGIFVAYIIYILKLIKTGQITIE